MLTGNWSGWKVLEQIMDFDRRPSDRNTYEKGRRQAMQGARTSKYLRDISWKNKYLRPEGTVKIYSAELRK